MRRIISLTTDFGSRDPYVGEMKAVILGICSDATIIDITHEIEKFNTRMAAYVLASATPYFPPGTIHVAVIDPSVGTKRRPIVVQTRKSYFVGPDNGVLDLATEKQGINSVHEITNPKVTLQNVSSTFHGRDVFAPVAAHLANGVALTSFGPEIQEFAKSAFSKVTFSKGKLAGEILHIDGFGNIITNFNEQDLSQLHVQDSLIVDLPGFKARLRIGKTYAEAKPAEALVLMGSHGYVEIAVNQGNAAESIKVKPGDRIQLSVRK